MYVNQNTNEVIKSNFLVVTKSQVLQKFKKRKLPDNYIELARKMFLILSELGEVGYLIN